MKLFSSTGRKGGFTLMETLLAIGLVVDDAIVVVEAAQVQIEQGKTPREAATEAMRHVASPIIATTVVLLAHQAI